MIGATYDFSNVNIGSSLSTFIVVQNSGALNATSVSGSALSGDFIYVGGSYPGTNGTCGTTIFPGTCTIELLFTPTNSGLRTDSISLSYAGASAINLNLQGTGVVVPTATLTLSDGPTYDYGSVIVGNTQDHTFTVTNVGAATATSMSGSSITSPYTFKGGSYPGTGGTCGATLSASGSCTVVVSFDPLSAAIFNDTLDIYYDDGVGTVSSSRSITGTGINTPSFSITGVTGGVDTIADNVLENSQYAEIHWNDVTGETSYTVTIFEADGTTIRCGPVTQSADTLNYNFSGCALVYGDSYNVEVTATVSGTPIAASNSQFSFSVDFIPVVTAKYPNNGANWNDYIYGSTDTACIAGTHTDCTNGGLLRKVDLPVEATCSGLTAYDSLSAFTWYCSDISGHAIFYSSGFEYGMGLSDVLNGSSFANNSVIITGGATTYTTDPATPWWNNTIVALSSNASSQSLTGSGVIYTFVSNITTAGLNIQADRIAIVGQYNSSLSSNGTATDNCHGTTGALAGADTRCMIASPGYNFLWIEGNFDGYHSTFPTENGIFLVNARFAHLQNIKASNFSRGILLSGTERSRLTNITPQINSISGVELNSSSQYNRLDEIYASSNTINGILLNNSSSFNYLTNLHLSNNGDGLAINGASNSNKVRGLYAFNNSSYGLHILGSSLSNVVVDVVLAGGNYGGISLSSASGLRLSNVTIANAGTTNYGGLRIYSGSDYVIRNVLSLNNDWGVEIGISSGVVNNSTVANVAVASPGAYALTHVGSSVDFKGIIKTDGTCFSNASGLDNSCTPTLGTQVTSSFTGSTTIVGKVTSDTNPTSTSGLGSYSTSALDWFSFDTLFRGWGLNGSAFPNSDNVGRCTTGSCSIWDLALQVTDTTALNRTGDGSAANGAFTNGSSCPSAASGSDVITHTYTGEIFVRNATEIVDPDDGIGDDDGLCESGEACIYNPNFGGYQGDGDYTTESCTFSPGTVTGVTMFGYPNNGY